MYRALLIVFATVSLQGCAGMTLDQAVITHNTARAMGTLTAGGVAAEFVQQQGWRDAR
jgi:hypothetical protein